MIFESLPRPSPLKLEWLTPSIANDLLDCFYRVSWQLDPVYRSLNRPSTYSELGMVAHGIVEDAGHGMFRASGDARTAIERRWEERAALAEQELARAWSPTIPPQLEQWPGYHMTRARIIRRALQQSHPTSSDSKTLRDRGAMVAEHSLSDDRTQIRGRPDRLEGSEGAKRVVDLKSGLRQAEPSPEQLRQLLIYGYLVEASNEGRVAEVCVEDASGRRWETHYDRGEAEALVRLLVDRRASYNRAVREASLEEHAAPSPGGCRWCPYRVVCGPYWSNLSTTWGQSSLLGTIRSAAPSRSGSILVIEVESPVDQSESTWVLSSVPEQLALAGSSIAVVDAEATGAGKHLRWRWSTLSWTPDAAAAKKDLT